MELNQFKHSMLLRVRSYEVDWQGIVHNSNYLRYFEVGRIEYLKDIGARITMKSIQGEGKVVLVRHEIDFETPAGFDDLLRVFTRTSYVRNSSFAMEGIMINEGTGQVVAKTIAFHVWLDSSTNRPKTIEDDFRKLVQQYEGGICEIAWPSIET